MLTVYGFSTAGVAFNTLQRPGRSGILSSAWQSGIVCPGEYSSGMTPKFNDDGCLPARIRRATLEEIARWKSGDFRDDREKA
jgi:hypothetical protein